MMQAQDLSALRDVPVACICGTTFQPPERTRGQKRKFCSRRCAVRAWRAANPEKHAAIDARQDEKKRALNALHPEISQAREAARYASDPARHRARVAAWRSANPEKVAAYRVAHPEVFRASSAAYRARNPEKVAAYRAAYYAAHSDRWHAWAVAWRAANPDKVHHAIATRRARRRGNGGSHTLAEWRAKCALFCDSCAYCGEVKKLTRDHKVPLSRGGTDDIRNIVPSCRSCNSKKMTRTAAEFFALTG